MATSGALANQISNRNFLCAVGFNFSLAKVLLSFPTSSKEEMTSSCFFSNFSIFLP